MADKQLDLINKPLHNNAVELTRQMILIFAGLRD